jgi:small subunit ribosomal protein S3
MGQKVNPLGYRLGKLYTWKSRWFADSKNYQKLMLEDIALRQFLFEKLKSAGVVKVEIERSINKIVIIIHVARPGVVIGRGGTGLEMLKKLIAKKLGQTPKKDKNGVKIDLQIREVKNPELSAQISSVKLEDMLIKRYPHRRAVAQVLEKIMSAGARGTKIVLSGRIDGAEISRTEKFTAGSMPAQTLRADIDYAQRPALTKSGYVGIKIWIYKGEEEIK